MIEQDYLLRQIKEFIAVMMKMLFGAELKSADQLEELRQKYDTGENDVLYRMIDAGKIREAETLLYESMQAKTAEYLMKGYCFYQYLAQKDEEFLEAHGYHRDMIADGIRRLAALFGAPHIGELFLND